MLDRYEIESLGTQPLFRAKLHERFRPFLGVKYRKSVLSVVSERSDGGAFAFSTSAATAAKGARGHVGLR